jgi:hypothetical protein
VADEHGFGPSARSDHAAHDRLLIAALAADDLTAGERERAEVFVAHCAPCAELAADLRAIAQATSATRLPVPARPRSFTLSPDDAARIRPSGWRAFVRRFGSADWSFTRPLAAGLTTLGLAGLLVSALPGFPSAAPAASPAASFGAAEQAPAASPMEGAARGSGTLVTPSLTARVGSNPESMPTASHRLEIDAASPAPAPQGSRATAPVLVPPTVDPPWLTLGSAAVFAAGVTLFALRRLAGRLG